MKKIDVQISKGEIESFSVTLKDGQPTVTATVGLFTANSKKITTFQISTESYYGAQFELPTEMIPPIIDIAQRLEGIVINECNRKMAMIGQ